jgi:hydrogenase maturation factor
LWYAFVISLIKQNLEAGNWWLIHVILATQKAEIRRIKVQNQPWETVHKTLSQKYKKGLVEWLKR